MITYKKLNYNNFLIEFPNSNEEEKFIYINGFLIGVTKDEKYTISLTETSVVEVLEEHEIPTGFYDGRVLINVTNTNTNYLKLYVDDVFITNLYSASGNFEYYYENEVGEYNIKIKNSDDITLSETNVVLIKSPIIEEFDFYIDSEEDLKLELL